MRIQKMIYPDMPDELANFYWPHWWCIGDDGTLTIKVTGYDAEMTHFTGFRNFAPSAPDYKFWVWIVRKKKPGGLILREELVTLKAEYADFAEPNVA